MPANREIVSWISQNQQIINQTLLDHRERLIRKDLASEEFSFSKYKISEMGLCVAVNSLILPPGYKTTGGRGRVIDMTGRERFHVFAVNNDNVLCFTPGWFLANQGNYDEPGAALRQLISQAPDLFIPTDSVVALNGHKDEIYQKLNLKYKW